MDFSGNQAITTSRRIMAIWLPRLPTDRLQRKRNASKLSSPPLVIAAKTDNAMRIYALDRRAAKLGLHVGQPLANARAMIDPLDVVEADDAADSKLLVHIADWCERFTPYVAISSPDALYLDVTGVTHLFGGERPMIETVATAIRKQSFAVSVAMAGTAIAARAFSRYAPDIVVASGKEAQTIATLPVGALGCTEAITHALRRAGLKTIGQVASRQRAELCSRFGKGFVSILERALGQSESPISPRLPLPDYMAEHRFAEPVTAEAVVLATLKSLAASIAQVLEQRGQGARALEAVFFRADGAVRRIALQTGSPTRDPALIQRLFRLKLDSLTDHIDPGFGFDLIRLEATLAQRSEAQSIGFDDNANEEKEVSQLIDTLSARFGRQRVLRFVPQDTHIPEAASVTVPAQESLLDGVSWPMRHAASQGPRRPLRLFERPEPIDVVAQVPEGPPLRFRWRRVLHTAAVSEGPERIAMDWWRHQESKPTRDYFRVQDTEGRRFWLYRDGLYSPEAATPRWFMHGVFA
jgi:protein ImuB